MKINMLIVVMAALIPLVMGFIWYNPKLFGKAWMQASGLTEEKMKGANMLVIFGVTFLLSFFFAFGMQFITIHQFHINSLFYRQDISDPNSEAGAFYKSIMDKLGGNFRTFKHGVAHGLLACIATVMPVITINALFERKGFKYIAINVGYWLVCMMLMGGVICAFT